MLKRKGVSGNGTIIADRIRMKRHLELARCAGGNCVVDICGSEMELPALRLPPLHTFPI